MSVVIIGAGVAGLCCACECIDRGIPVDLYEQSGRIGESSCSWFAGGMLAPWCEAESAENVIIDYGLSAIEWWARHVEPLYRCGSLVMSARRDRNELNRFSRLTEEHERLDAARIEALEPELAGRFEHGLYYAGEAHLDPRRALLQLHEYLLERGGRVHLGTAVQAEDFEGRWIIDCRGYAAHQSLPELRGVKGEMLILRTDDIRLTRPVRLLHPRYPVYIVPRDSGYFMLGATMIENDGRHRVSARSMLELLSAAYALHPAFAEAEIAEIGVDVRPAFNDNLPKAWRRGKTLFINGLYRHGFLLGPEMARRAAEILLGDQDFTEAVRCA